MTGWIAAVVALTIAWTRVLTSCVLWICVTSSSTDSSQPMASHLRGAMGLALGLKPAFAACGRRDGAHGFWLTTFVGRSPFAEEG
eukprot:CAMPEP_0170622476 /NCGR_PEP_ID=MMETSP0224-20130122/29153_1 /TAXON_ID=285029 /ORGANISM="Togula jolla, Strain CCCM 725" /LENGTH=84 /DNA_ID=CAMNT_0010948801 /DNA_START=24 /DNA_END=274 /DNA_ORIENTATION=-